MENLIGILIGKLSQHIWRKLTFFLVITILMTAFEDDMNTQDRVYVPKRKRDTMARAIISKTQDFAGRIWFEFAFAVESLKTKRRRRYGIVPSMLGHKPK